MKNLRSRFERFCFRNRDKGIANLMLYISLGCATVYLMGLINQTNILYVWLRFDRNLILKGELWRLFTYPLTYGTGDMNLILVAVSLLCYYSLGRAIEHAWGTFRFNLFYLTGVVLMDVFCLIFPGWSANVSYLNLSLFLAYATMYPNTHFLLFFIIPVRAWIFALFYLAITLYDVITLSVAGVPLPLNLFPLIALANYFLFFGKDVLNVIPMSWRVNARRLFRKKPKQKKFAHQTGTIPFPKAGSYEAEVRVVKTPYTHRCTVCGRTDVSNPELEFRYCSCCGGYHCYCEDHISNHTHVE